MAGLYNAILTGDWQRLGSALSTLAVRFPAAMQDALVEEGEFYRRKIVEGIREQAPGGRAFKPLSAVTLALRKLMGFGGTKALIRTGELRNNVVTVAKNDTVFVGVLYTARGEDGRSLADIGRIHEFGAVLRSSISKKRMRLIAQALRKAGMKSSGGTGGGGHGVGMVRIPARPFIRPVISMYGGQRGAERYMARVSRKLGGLLGVIGHPDLKGRGVGTVPERLAGRNAGRGVRMVRQGLGKTKVQKLSMQRAFSRSIKQFTRPAGRLSKPQGKTRGPRIIRPRVVRAKRPLKPRKVRAPRPPRAPKTAKAPRVRKPRAPSGKSQAKQAARYNRAQQRKQEQAAKSFARQNKAAAAQSARAARAAAKAKVRAAKGQRINVRKVAKKALRAQYKSEKSQGMHKQHNAHVKARNRQPQHNAHVKARNKQNPQHNAHVKARNRQPQQNAHVKAYRKQQQQNSHVKAYRRFLRKNK